MSYYQKGWVEWKQSQLGEEWDQWRPLLDASIYLPPKDMDAWNLLFSDPNTQEDQEFWNRGLPEDISPFVESQAYHSTFGGINHTWITLAEFEPYAPKLPPRWRVLYDFMTRASGFVAFSDEQEMKQAVRVILWWNF